MNRHAAQMCTVLDAIHARLDAHGMGHHVHKTEAKQGLAHPLMQRAFELSAEGTPEALAEGHALFVRVLIGMREACRHFKAKDGGADPLVNNFIAFVDGVIPDPGTAR